MELEMSKQFIARIAQLEADKAALRRALDGICRASPKLREILIKQARLDLANKVM